MTRTILGDIGVFEKLKKNCINQKLHIEKSWNIKDVLLAPFKNFDVSNNFRNKFITEFYKKFFNDKNILFPANNLYYCIVIGILYIVDKFNNEELYKSEKGKYLLQIYKNTSNILKANIYNEKVFFQLKFKLKSSKIDLKKIIDLDYISYLEKYPVIFRMYKDNIHGSIDPYFILSLHFMLIEEILRNYEICVSNFYTTSIMDDNNHNTCSVKSPYNIVCKRSLQHFCPKQIS